MIFAVPPSKSAGSVDPIVPSSASTDTFAGCAASTTFLAPAIFLQKEALHHQTLQM